MNLKILLFILFAASITSCSTTYRSGQTPDDVYYSPARPIEVKHEEETVKKQEVRRGYVDRQIVMSIHDPRWRSFDDDYDSYYDPYRYGYTCGYYYNPYYYPSPVYFSGTTFTNPKNSTPRMINLGSYNNYSNMVVVNPKAGYTTQVKSFRYNNNNTDKENIRRILVPTTPTYNNSATRFYDNSSNNSRTYSPSTNSSSGSSSGSSSSGSSGAPVSRPRR